VGQQTSWCKNKRVDSVSAAFAYGRDGEVRKHPGGNRKTLHRSSMRAHTKGKGGALAEKMTENRK